MLRWSGDPRLAALLLVVAVACNVAAVVVPDGSQYLRHPAYLTVIGLILLAGLAGVAVRLPAAWREWRRPSPLSGRRLGRASIAVDRPLDAVARRRLVQLLEAAGYRAREAGTGRWAVHGTRRGWSRFAGLGSHAALVLVVVAAASSGATARESVFSLLPGEQALLDAPSRGFSDAVRFDELDAQFGPDRRPLRLDTTVTFLRDGEPVRTEILQVNRPGSFGGYLVHGWTYGPAARVRVTTIAGRPLLDAAVPLDDERRGVPIGGAELPSIGAAIGLALLDADANAVAVSAVSGGGTDTATLRPGEERRLGGVVVRLEGLEAYVTFLARRDPALPFLIVACGTLVAMLAVAFWLPRRRVTLRDEGERLSVLLAGERFDDPSRDLEALAGRLREALA